MALELFTNDAQSTTTGSINNSSDPVTFSVTSAAAFPATGNFTIKIDSEYLLVTSVAGAAFTATRAQEGSTIASHSSGATVTLVLAAASHQRIIGEFHLTDTAANRPAAGTKGRLFFPSDGAGAIFRDTGSVWQAWAGGLGPFTPPIGDFTTWVNQGSRGSIDETSGLTFFRDLGPSTASEMVMSRVKTAPATPWTLTVAIKPFFMAGSLAHAGLTIRDSSTGKQMTFGRFHNASGFDRSSIFLWNSATSLNSTTADETHSTITEVEMFRLVNNGTTLSFEYSANFRDWVQYRTQNVSGYFVANIDQVGFYQDIYSVSNNASATGGVVVYHAGVG